MQCPACGVRAALVELPGKWPESDDGANDASAVKVWTAVSLACASCGAKVWPCGSCDDLLPLPTEQQPPASGATSSYARTFCGHCGALNVTGARDRLRLGLPPLQALPLEQVQALQLRLVGRRAYTAAKHNELASLLKAAASQSGATNRPLAVLESSDSPMAMVLATATTASGPAHTPRGEGLAAAPLEEGSLPHAHPAHCTQSWLWQEDGDSHGPARKRRRRTENFLPAQALPSSKEQQSAGDRVDGGVHASLRAPSNELDHAITRCRWQLLQLESPAVGSAEGDANEQDGGMKDDRNVFSHHHLVMLQVLCSNADDHDEAAGMVTAAESYLMSRPKLLRLKSAVTDHELVWRQSKLDTALFEQHYGPRAGISMAVLLPALFKERHAHAGKVHHTASAPHAGLLGAVNRVLDSRLEAWLKTHGADNDRSNNDKQGEDAGEDMDDEEEEELRWLVSEESSLPGLCCARNAPGDAAVAAQQVFHLCQMLYRSYTAASVI